jgi:hypothetical protein
MRLRLKFSATVKPQDIDLLILCYNAITKALPVARRTVDVAVIIPDASPVLTLARIGRIDLLGSFTVPVRIVDQECIMKSRSRKTTRRAKSPLR